ncbi:MULTISPECIES: hypothetical protein [unclassified Mesorhizobium]|uniref:hypothetical protein n=1 Tax=unclassified Mesorhizobium TaxID=325217 RepID=UPI000FDB10F6|nr:MULTISPECIES: hypothetical protein [unclassified Mesorhizobium]TGR39570.1 hypothetical protein EN842_40775 [bacterium M00.F.Ca.ET.199.01.1.1]TGU29007.1 hypothetical protein EN799_35950 [bacterium M00.F.Ca.ET.156.01.1.1]TGV84290.1 hypothetical protein EN792_021540 [Mesorhizobium sp. M00.F.Ca.ET.149.01.1.1]TGR22397.1 hypothetical protein EN845_22090 [Mesorhizobium sp. M8A.F.Ca.ET.202.01.1.1]TGR23878.1 hypothetical protein EN840_20735 [Mesorhizobium sp. M8A.F.Ca.ET.197.01.1.1]
MTIDHQNTAAIELAGEWLSKTSRDRISRPIVPTLKERFGLSSEEAIAAIREANLRRQRAA